MASTVYDLPRHRLLHLLEPASLLLVSDQRLPFAARLPARLSGRVSEATLSEDGRFILPARLAGVAQGERLCLAVVCVAPARLREVLQALRRLRPRSVLILRHPQPPVHMRDDISWCRQWGLRHDCLVLGPGSFGLQRPHLGLNLSLDPYLAPEGRVALIAQSTTLMAAMLDWAQDTQLGFSALVSVGDHSTVDIAELIDFLAMDGRTQSIVIYLEDMPPARRFGSAVRAATTVKPVVVLKSGREITDDAVFNALLRRAGALRVRYFIQLFSAIKVLETAHRPQGRHIALVSNGRAAARLALDAMGPDAAVRPAQLSQASMQALAAGLEDGAAADNPLITYRPLTAERLEAMLRVLMNDKGVDGVLVLVAPDPHADLDALAQCLASLARQLPRPVMVCFMGDARMAGLRHHLDQAGVPAFHTPESAVQAFGLLASYHYNQTLAQQTRPPEPLAWPPRLERARTLLRWARNENRRQLTPAECRELFACFYVPVEQRTDAAGPAMSIYVGRHALLGPYFVFGPGHQLARPAALSRAVELPPMNRYLARQLVERSSLWRQLLVDQLKPDACALLHEALERLSDMVCELPTLESIRIDPLLPGNGLLHAGRIEVQIGSQSLLVLPETAGYPHLAIHPYPHRLVQERQFSDGQPWLLRPIRSEDARALQDFVRGLSDRSRYMRFVSMLSELTPQMLARYTSIDYDRELALVACISLPNPDYRGYPQERIIGFAHYLRNADGRGAEYALAIADDWQRYGLGSQLMRALVEAAQMQGLTYLDGYVLAGNQPMLALMRRLGFRNDAAPDEPGMRRVWLDLGETVAQDST